MKKRILQRQQRVRAKIKNQGRKRKLTVFRSSRHIWAQIVDLTQGRTLVAFSSKALMKMPKYRQQKLGRLKAAELSGYHLAKKALKLGIKRLVFDRGHYAYHGRVKALAEGARRGGLKF